MLTISDKILCFISNFEFTENFHLKSQTKKTQIK